MEQQGATGNTIANSTTSTKESTGDFNDPTRAVTSNNINEDETLPMLLWLRGDEDICQQFTIDADEAMDQLGIRRSRLTQISGRELRVGRMRSGRYIRPVFRQVDIDSYKDWTRPTASHTKSADLVAKALEPLKSASVNFDEKLQNLESAFSERFDMLNENLRRQNIQVSRQISEEIHRQRKQILQLKSTIEFQNKAIQVLSDKTSNISTKVAVLPSLLQESSDIGFQVADLSQSIQRQESNLSDNADMLLAHAQTIMNIIDDSEKRTAIRINSSNERLDQWISMNLTQLRRSRRTKPLTLRTLAKQKRNPIAIMQNTTSNKRLKKYRRKLKFN